MNPTPGHFDSEPSHIEIVFEIYGQRKEVKYDSYNAIVGMGVDQRVIDFFRNHYFEAQAEAFHQKPITGGQK